MVEKRTAGCQEMVRMRVVFTVSGIGAVSVRHDLEYRTGDGQPLQMDVYSPSGAPGPHPAVVLVQGADSRHRCEVPRKEW